MKEERGKMRVEGLPVSLFVLYVIVALVVTWLYVAAIMGLCSAVNCG